LSVIPVPRYDGLWWANPYHKLFQAKPLLNLPEDERRTILLLQAAYRDLPNHAAEIAAHDRGLATYFYERGFTYDAMHIANILLAQTCCASINRLSCADLLREMQADHAGKDEFRIREGYAPLLDYLARDLNIQFNARVTAIQWNNPGITAYYAEQSHTDMSPSRAEFMPLLEFGEGQICEANTGRGQTARACIITLPVSLLKSNAIHFDPPLDSRKQNAIASFQMEHATKLIYQFTERLWDDSLIYMAHTGSVTRWWTPGYSRPDAPPIISAYVTANYAQHLDNMPESDALALGLRELSDLIGVKDLSSHLVSARRISWMDDPLTRGGYASLPPGHADARVILAEPVANTLFFAGEATAYDSNPQTVHGAFESGIRAARQAIAALQA
jgi:monoamine oxidase